MILNYSPFCKLFSLLRPLIFHKHIVISIRTGLPLKITPLTTPSPQPSYIRDWGLTSGFDCPRASTFAFFRSRFGWNCVGVTPETVVSVFPQTMVSFRLNLASAAYVSVFGTSRGFVSLCASQSRKEVVRSLLVHWTHLFLSGYNILYIPAFVNPFL